MFFKKTKKINYFEEKQKTKKEKKTDSFIDFRQTLPLQQPIYKITGTPNHTIVFKKNKQPSKQKTKAIFTIQRR